nr:glycosyltransferase family 9 protein [Pyrinomonadaceae bacterium]
MSDEVKPKDSTFPVDWSSVRRVLIVRLRSIGDTVLVTPFLHALREFLPEAQIDVLLEDWVAPLLDGYEDIDRTIAIDCKNLASRLRVGRNLRRARYDVAFNLHAGTTAALLVRASGAAYRIGYDHARLKHLHNIIAPPAHVLWGTEI